MSATPIRAASVSSFCGSATPGTPTWTGRVKPSAARAAIHDAMAAGSKQSWVVT